MIFFRKLHFKKNLFLFFVCDQQNSRFYLLYSIMYDHSLKYLIFFKLKISRKKIFNRFKQMALYLSEKKVFIFEVWSFFFNFFYEILFVKIIFIFIFFFFLLEFTIMIRNRNSLVKNFLLVYHSNPGITSPIYQSFLCFNFQCFFVT
jgi:hypothetical protein